MASLRTVSLALTVFTTMRRRSFNRPNEKLRGAERRLRSLNKWADSFEGYFPSEHASEKYWNWKIPVLDRLVCPPTTTDAIQKHCAQAILRAIGHIEKAKPPEHSNAIVSALITYPQMFSSEICIFFDKGYFEHFYQRSSEWQSLSILGEGSLSESLDLNLPTNFQERGYLFQSKDEWEGQVTTHEEQWWCYSDT